MYEASIIVDFSTLQLSGSIITSTIYLQVGQEAFPEKGWNDNTAIILSWWLDSVGNDGGKFLFMEGSFYFKQSKPNVTLVAGGKEQASYPIDWQKLNESIIKVAEQVIQYLDAKGYSHQDLGTLKDRYSMRKNWLL